MSFVENIGFRVIDKRVNITHEYTVSESVQETALAAVRAFRTSVLSTQKTVSADAFYDLHVDPIKCYSRFPVGKILCNESIGVVEGHRIFLTDHNTMNRESQKLPEFLGAVQACLIKLIGKVSGLTTEQFQEHSQYSAALDNRQYVVLIDLGEGVAAEFFIDFEFILKGRSDCETPARLIESFTALESELIFDVEGAAGGAGRARKGSASPRLRAGSGQRTPSPGVASSRRRTSDGSGRFDRTAASPVGVEDPLGFRRSPKGK